MKNFIICITLIGLSSCKIIDSEKQDIPIEDSSTPKTIIINEDGTSVIQEGEQPISDIPIDEMHDDEESSESVPVAVEEIIIIPDTIEDSQQDQNNSTYPLITSPLIPDEAINYVSLFVFYANVFNKPLDHSKLIIEFETSPSSFYIAFCSKVNNNQNPKIKFNKNFWNQLSNAYKEQLIFHELGHCLLNRSHQGNDFNNPSSIMNSSLFADSKYVQDYDLFLKELFNKSDHAHHFEYGQLRPNE